MAKDKKRSGKTKLPGLSLEMFKAAVDTVGKLIAEGKYLAFLSQLSFVRFIGPIEPYAKSLRDTLGAKKLETRDARRALNEVRNFTQLWLALRTPASRERFLKEEVFADEFRSLSPAEKSRFKKVLNDKLACIQDARFTAALRRRLERLRSAVGPCLEDMDVEAISRRQDSLEEEEVTQPFLRLRLRYSAGAEGVIPPPLLRGIPWGSTVGALPAKSFEVECDETDIDLLIRRLSDAKDLLLQSIAPPRDQEVEDKR